MGENLTHEIIGIREGEKLHEVMIPVEEARNAVDMGDHYVIQPSHHWWNVSNFKKEIELRGKPMQPLQEYASNTNTQWLSSSDLRVLVNSI